MQLRGILDTSGTFAESRAATLPLAPSPFEAALERALSGNVDATAEPVLQRIARCFSAADRLAAGVLAKGGPAAGGPAVGDPAACRPAAAAEHAPLRPQYRSSSLGNPTAGACMCTLLEHIFYLKWEQSDACLCISLPATW